MNNNNIVIIRKYEKKAEFFFENIQKLLTNNLKQVNKIKFFEVSSSNVISYKQKKKCRLTQLQCVWIVTIV